MLNTIVKVNSALKDLGANIPSGVWAAMKNDDIFNYVIMKDDETGVDYIRKTDLAILKYAYQKLYDQPSLESPSDNKVEEVKPSYKYVINGLGFNSSDELKDYLSQMLRRYKAEQSLIPQDKSFLADLLSRSPVIKKEVERYGKVVDLIVAVKPGYSGKSFHIVYANGRRQHISMKNYIDPGTEKLVSI